MTERLYYTDSKLLSFDATVIETGSIQDKFFAILDKTAFFPTSGGQPHDIGLLNGVNVTDVTEDDHGVIKHISDKQFAAKGTKVHGEIAPHRRHYFRQLHTAQHILSRAFIDLFGIETVSFHLGLDYGAIELPAPSITTEQLQKADNFTFNVVQENQPIEIIFADEKEAAMLPLRKKPERAGTIRIINIGQLDWSACGGTHCTCTSEVGLIKIIGVEKQRGNSLVKFLAGSKLKSDYDSRFQVTDSLTKSLTCSIGDLPGRIEKLTEENKQLQHQLSQLQLQLLPAKVEALSATVIETGKVKLVFQSVSDIDPKLLNQLASETAKKINGLAALFFENRLCLAVSDTSQLDSGQIVKQLASQLNLKGGGNKNIAQLGGVDPQRLNELKETLLAVLK